MSFKKVCIFYFHIVFLCASRLKLADAGSNDTDHLALLHLKSMISQDPRGVLTSWNTYVQFCNWYGITCGSRHKRVVRIDLSAQGLVGFLSPQIGNLTFLRELRLTDNTFRGDLPPELGRLFRLQVLNVLNNTFGGLIPANLSRCLNLVTLRLDDNYLVGPIPHELTSLSNLEILSFQRNMLTGGLPPSIGNLTALEAFSTLSNPLGGRIPDSIGQLTSLQLLHLGICNLSGTIPPSIYNLSSLATFSLADNELTGTILPAIGVMLPRLEWLQLCDNRLTGSIPFSLSNCSSLGRLELWNNNLEGKVNVDFSNARNLTFVILDGNRLGSGEPDEMKFIDSLSNCSQLKVLNLIGNRFSGELPNSVGNLSRRLFYLNLANNRLSGVLPSSVGNLVGLTSLGLDSNRFTGNVPTTIGNLQNIQRLALSDNLFSGSVPDSLGNLTFVIEIYLESNILQGVLPSSLGDCQKLLLLNLQDNNLTGNIPVELFQLSSLSISLNLARNNFSGSIPLQIRQLTRLENLDLSDNDLSGNIPDTLGECTSLVNLYLQGNLFQGTIPSALSSLRGVINADFSRNNLSGQIPLFLEQISFEHLNLSLNAFEGEVPNEGAFRNATRVSIFGNSRLCGGLTEFGLPKCSYENRGKRIHFIVIGVSTAFAVLVLIVLVLFLLFRHKKKRNVKPAESTMKDQFQKISYEELLKATDGFSESNLIGVGGFSSVYKGILGEDGILVAVKILKLESQGAEKSFIAECEALRNVRHRNLVKIVTACSSIDFQGNDFKALVFEFMPNGSLEKWLHMTPWMTQFGLLQRLNVLIDVASAIDYLHNDTENSIIHCDLKPSNILLDENMIAHVGDFGLARFLQRNADRSSSIGIRGTVGYAAPEYGLGSEMTTYGDVYSFGILLLEIMTGKRPTDDMFNQGLTLHAFVANALTDHIAHIVDPMILEFDEETAARNANKWDECFVSTIKIGIRCSLESPQDRMKIKNVVPELRAIRKIIL